MNIENFMKTWVLGFGQLWPVWPVWPLCFVSSNWTDWVALQLLMEFCCGSTSPKAIGIL